MGNYNRGGMLTPQINLARYCLKLPQGFNDRERGIIAAILTRLIKRAHTTEDITTLSGFRERIVQNNSP